MRGLWTMTRLELRLLVRGRGLWIAAAIMALLGVWEASAIREAPYGAWGTFTSAALLITLILTFTTGDQVVRDRERRMDGVLLSTPVSTLAYVWSKYLVAVVALLGSSVVYLIAAVLMDHFDTGRDPPAILGHSQFPPLGPGPYLAGWVWLVVTPLVFGAALTLAGITLARGQRVAAYAAALLLWLVPAFIGEPEGLALGVWSDLLDVVGLHINQPFSNVDAASAIFDRHLVTGAPLSNADRTQIVRLVQQSLPPRFPAIFFWNRGLFLGLALALVTLTVWSVARWRQGRA